MKITTENTMINDMIMSVMGVDRLAYVKPVMDEDDLLYVVFAADGTELASFATRDEAHLSIMRNNLTPVNIH